jgi:hypothetical protein
MRRRLRPVVLLALAVPSLAHTPPGADVQRSPAPDRNRLADQLRRVEEALRTVAEARVLSEAGRRAACVQVTAPVTTTSPKASAPSGLTAEEQTRRAIYTAVLRPRRSEDWRRLVVSTTEAPRAAVAQRFRSAPGGAAAPSAVASLALKSEFKTGERIDARLLPEGTRLVEAEEIRAFFAVGARDAWERFRDVWGVEGYASVSTVSLTPDGRTALVYVSSACGPLCGAASYVWFVRRGALADWSVGGTVVVTVS